MQTVLSAVIAFIATNIDDIFLIAVYFSQLGQSLRTRHIVLGQYLGFLAIFFVSLIGFFGGLLIPEAGIGLLGLVPLYLGLRQLLNGAKEDDDDENEALELPATASTSNTLLNAFLSPQSYAIALVMIANGGDNLGVYIPLFAGKSFAELGIMLTVFMLMLALWIYLGYRIGSFPLLKRSIERYEHLIVPLVLIALGLYILFENGTIAAALAIGFGF